MLKLFLDFFAIVHFQMRKSRLIPLSLSTSLSWVQVQENFLSTYLMFCHIYAYYFDTLDIMQAINALSQTSMFPAEKILYVMTDFTWNNLKFWNDHESFRPHLDSGQLDIAIFDAVHDEVIKYTQSSWGYKIKQF